jgi:hypothetical protein
MFSFFAPSMSRGGGGGAPFFPLDPGLPKLTRLSLSLPFPLSLRALFLFLVPRARNRTATKKNETKKTEIGVGLTAFGVLFTFLGVAFFFDRGLLAMGNVLFLSGVALSIGPRATLRFFTRRKNMRVRSRVFFWKRERGRMKFLPSASLSLSSFPPFCLTSAPSLLSPPPRSKPSPSFLQGSSIFAGGIVLVLMGWAATGMAVETYGFWLLFAGFFPTVLGFLRRAPVLGPLLDTPGVKRALNRVAPAQSLPM